MEKFLTTEIENKFKKVTFDYTYANEKDFNGYKKRHISSISDMNPCDILLSMMKKNLIIDSYELLGLIYERKIIGACQYLAEQGDMIVQISDLVSSPNYTHEIQEFEIPRFVFQNGNLEPLRAIHGLHYPLPPRIVCPKEMQDYQKLRLRLWFEFFSKYNQGCVVFYPDYFGEDKLDFHEEDVLDFLDEQCITNDDYIRSLVKKYPLENQL